MLHTNIYIYDVVRGSRNVIFLLIKLCRICMKPVVIFFFLFWLLRIKGKVFDEIKHLFGQFQMIYY